MRKFKMLIVAFAAIMTIGSLCSCGSDDKDNEDTNNVGGKDKTEVPNYVGGTIYSFFLTTDVTLDAYDVTVDYKTVKGDTISYTFTKDDVNLVSNELGQSLGLTTGAWYNARVGEGKKVYACRAKDEIQVPADVTYIVDYKFNYKGEQAITHISSTGKEAVTVDCILYSFISLKCADGKSVNQTIYDEFGEAVSTATGKSESFGISKSKKRELGVTLTSTGFTPRRIQ